jgi:hypothetical protein
MAWWDIPDGGVIGDRPADVITLALQAVVEERTDAGRDRPALDELLNALGRALPGEPRPLRARLQDGSQVPATSGREAEDVAIALREAFAEIDRHYGERFGRAPSMHELLETVLFVLMGGAADFLAGGESLKEIEETG